MKVYFFLEEEIRRQIRRYLVGDISLDDFSDWFVGKMWDVEQTSPEETQQLVYKIDNALIRYSEGLITLSELRYFLSCFVDEETTEMYSNSVTVKVNHSNDFYQVPSPSRSRSEVAYV